MGKNSYEFIFDVKLASELKGDSVDSKLSSDNTLIDGKKQKKEITDNDKIAETEKISKGTMGVIFADMLLAMPILLLGGVVGIYSFLKDIVGSIFKGEDEEEVDVNLVTLDPIGEPPAGLTEFEYTVDQPETITPPDITTPELLTVNEDGTYSVKYDVSVNMTDNSDEVVKHFEKINALPLSAPIDQWATDFESSARKEKDIIDNQLNKPFITFNSTLTKVIANKNTVDRYLDDIKAMKKKIRVAKAKKAAAKVASYTVAGAVYNLVKSNKGTSSNKGVNESNNTSKGYFTGIENGQSKWPR